MSKRTHRISPDAFLMFTGRKVAAWRLPSASDSMTLAIHPMHGTGGSVPHQVCRDDAETISD